MRSKLKHAGTREKSLHKPTPDQERLLQALAYEEQQPQMYWWLSFADSNKPKGEQFLGATIVKAGGPASAIRRTHVLNINPGGQVAYEKIGKLSLFPEMVDVLVVDGAEVRAIVAKSKKGTAS